MRPAIDANSSSAEVQIGVVAAEISQDGENVFAEASSASPFSSREAWSATQSGQEISCLSIERSHCLKTSLMYSPAARLAADPIGRVPIWTAKCLTCSNALALIVFKYHSQDPVNDWKALMK